MKLQTINPFEEISKEYDQWFDENPFTFQSELEAVKYFTPIEGKGIEIGIGTGRFAKELGIRFGIEPSESMAKYAKERGIEVIVGEAENMPYNNQTFDFAIMVAVDPFVKNIEKVYSEIYRILKPDGKLVVGTLHKNGAVANKYISMTDSEVYRNALFHTIEETLNQLKASGFKTFQTCQTLTQIKPEMLELPITGHDKGSFVAIEAKK